jgi:prefoldin subunit 5
MIVKKDYEEVLERYKKCRAGLEKAIEQNKVLRANNRNNDIGYEEKDKNGIMSN